MLEPVAMRIINPATDEVIRELEDDTEELVTDKLRRARAGQKAWARTPLEERMLRLRRFRELVVERTEQLARTLTAEMGKPITQARNELKALLARIDFFLENVGRDAPGRGRHARPAALEETHPPRAARRGRQHLGLELSLLRRLQRLRARAAHRQRRALQAVRATRR